MKRIAAIILSLLIMISATFCVNASMYKIVMIQLTEKASQQFINKELVIDLNYFKRYKIDIAKINIWEPETQMEIRNTILFSIELGKDDSKYSAQVIDLLKQDENFMIVEHGGEKAYLIKNPMKVTVKTKTVKYNKVKKAKQTVAPITVKSAKGKVTYKKLSGSKKLTLKSNGKIVVKKGTKKGTYSAKIKVTAKGNSSYKSASKTVTVKVKVK